MISSRIDEQEALALSTKARGAHESNMRLAIDEARRNPLWPFGAIIVNAADGEVVARGVNEAGLNPTFHGEIVALNNYFRDHGNGALGDKILYTTAEPCPMCMGAFVWAGIGGVVFGTSIHELAELGIGQIMIDAAHLCRQADFFCGSVLGGVLSDDTTELFRRRLDAIERQGVSATTCGDRRHVVR
jgi:tRNA(Arg) A34 adenosine deaminase TadA